MLTEIEYEIQLYAEMAKEFRDGFKASGQCVDSSIEFLSLVEDKLTSEGYVLHKDFGVLIDSKAPSWHQVFFFSRWKIDFTYRQFDNDADFPRITERLTMDNPYDAIYSYRQNNLIAEIKAAQKKIKMCSYR